MESVLVSSYLSRWQWGSFSWLTIRYGQVMCGKDENMDKSQVE